MSSTTPLPIPISLYKDSEYPISPLEFLNRGEIKCLRMKYSQEKVM